MCVSDHFFDLLPSVVTPSVVMDMKRKREEQRAELNLHLGSTAMTPPIDSTPSPDEHPEFGALPSRPPMTPEPPTPAPPPEDHTQPQGQMSQHPSGCGPSVSGCGYMSGESTSVLSNHARFSGQPRPPSHGTASTSDSSVFAYGSSSDTYSDSSRTYPSSSQATPTCSMGSESSGCGGMNILHFSYKELSEATGGFTEGMVGIGAFGTVFRAKIRGNGPYAIKKLHTVSKLCR